ncbi:hypothetical protein Adt_28703 [Abeliophyllum distichum]|uniref:MMS19 nucleotide excision repair protein n=1 Tax=Abeliophyllum distichum TaxID=126358 RepID=A0ABD1RXB4_9LAMI
MGCAEMGLGYGIRGSYEIIKLLGFYSIPKDGEVELIDNLKFTFATVDGSVYGGPMMGELIADSTIQDQQRPKASASHLVFRIALVVVKQSSDTVLWFTANLGRNETSFSNENLYTPVELFGIIAECEKLEKPGEALLLKAKNLCWSNLAMVASCFADVSPLSCITVLLEITAARETSAIKVNDIASQIAKNVGAAVEATNSLPANARTNQKCLLALVVPRFKESFLKRKGDRKQAGEDVEVSAEIDDMAGLLSRMVAVLCEQRLFLPLLRAFEIFLPSCSLLPFVRARQRDLLGLPSKMPNLLLFSIVPGINCFFDYLISHCSKLRFSNTK